MIKLTPHLNFMVFVLASGLVSCSPDNGKSIPDYNPALPLIVKPETSLDLQAWDTNPTKDLSPADQLDWRKAEADHVEVETVCQSSADSFKSKTSPPSDELMTVFRILPEEILLMDLNQREVHCSFTLSLWNSAGARHVFFLQSRIVGEPPADVEIEKSGVVLPQEPLNQIQQSDLVGLQMRFLHSIPGHAHWTCQDITFPKQPFFQVADLSHFDLQRGKVREKHPRLSVELRPIQVCRIFIVRSQDGLPLGVSHRFKIKMITKELEWDFANKMDSPPSQALVMLYDTLFGGSTSTKLPLFTLRLRNPGLVPRQVRLPLFSQKVAGEFRVFGHRRMIYQGGGNPLHPPYNCAFSLPTLHWEAVDIALREEKTGQIAVIEPKSEVQFDIVYTSEQKLLHFPGRVLGLSIAVPEPIKIEELDVDGQVINTLNPKTKDLVLGSFAGAQSRPTAGLEACNLNR